METKIGRNITALIEDLKKNAPNYYAWQATFICEKLTKQLHPERKEYLLDQKGLNFRPYERYEYPPEDIRSLYFDDNIITIVFNFLGLYGINSPLPRCYHEQVALQQNIFDPGKVPLQNFMDIFNNRFYWLYYHSWKKYRYYLELSDNPENKITQRIHTFTGCGPFWEKDKTTIPHFALLKFSGILSHRVRSKNGLLMILNHLFPNNPISIKEFMPNWVPVSETPCLGSTNFKLGVNSILGRYALDYMSKICIMIGPISFDKYLEFIPQTVNAKRLCEILDLYLNDGINFDVKFKIQSQSIQPIELGGSHFKLGINTWLGNPDQDHVAVTYTHSAYRNLN